MKCTVCKQIFLKDAKNPSASKTKKTILPKSCPGCRIIGSRAPERPFKDKKK